MVKRVLSYLLVLCLTLGFFAACKESNHADDLSSRSNPANQDSSDEGTVILEKPDLPLSDSKTAQLTIALMENFYTPASYTKNLPVYEKLEEMTGVKVIWEVYPGNDYAAVMSTRLASA